MPTDQLKALCEDARGVFDLNELSKTKPVPEVLSGPEDVRRKLMFQQLKSQLLQLSDIDDASGS